MAQAYASNLKSQAGIPGTKWRWERFDWLGKYRGPDPLFYSLPFGFRSQNDRRSLGRPGVERCYAGHWVPVAEVSGRYAWEVGDSGSWGAPLILQAKTV